MKSITITLPIPHKSLSPNHTIGSRAGRMGKATQTKKARRIAFFLAEAAWTKNGFRPTPRWPAATVSIRYSFSTNRRRDRDNLLGWCKAYMDGIADAGIVANDAGFTYLPVESEVTKGYAGVSITITQEPGPAQQGGVFTMTETKSIHGDCLEVMRGMADNAVDLVFCSPPYEAARTYGIDFNLRGQAWVDWAVERYIECVRVSRGLVAWVVEGQTRQFRWTASPALLMADLHRAGIKLRKPPAYRRVGIPGSGGPDWLRNDYEFIVCASKGKLPWSENTAMGHPPKFAPGGQPSHRRSNGERVGSMEARATEPKAIAFLTGKRPPGAKLHTKNNGKTMRVQCYVPPARANPGNVVECVVGGGRMGHALAHENEAPFPEKLAEFFVRSFCPPGGIVLDPFSGSGTTIAVAKRLGRIGIGIDIRESQIELAGRRLAS